MKKALTLKIAGAMQSEIQRAMDLARIPKHPKPYYVSHLLRHEEEWRFTAKYGTLLSQAHTNKRTCFADVRIGSYRNDQVREGGLEDNDRDEESYGYIQMPTGDNLQGIRHALWRLTEARFREAMDARLQKSAHEITYLNTNRELSSFEKLPPLEQNNWKKLPDVDAAAWKKYVLKTSKLMQKFPEIMNSNVEFRATNRTRVFCCSNGSLAIDRSPFWSLDAYLWYLSPKGDAFTYRVSHFVTKPSELPSQKEYEKEITKAYELLKRIANAPSIRSFSGPVLLDPKPAGLLIHEAIGHRLEGSRLLHPGEGQTFRDSVNKAVLPEFLSLKDDPQLSTYKGHSLVGHYNFDDEGVPSQNVQLIKDGVLKTFLSSRTPISKNHKSNGHGRNARHERPISRMGVTILEAKKGLSDDAMKAAFVDEIKRQGVPYGIRVMEASGGETSTESYNFQAFLGEITVASRVYPDGTEELIRGVNFVGTPLNAVKNIVAAGKRMEIDNAFCGAESGYVPVSTVSPALLVSELELQSKSENPYTQYSYPMPDWD